MLELVLVLGGVVVALAIIVYSTWLFGHQLRLGKPKAKSFMQWVKHIFEAIWGL